MNRMSSFAKQIVIIFTVQNKHRWTVEAPTPKAPLLTTPNESKLFVISIKHNIIAFPSFGEAGIVGIAARLIADGKCACSSCNCASNRTHFCAASSKLDHSRKASYGVLKEILSFRIHSFWKRYALLWLIQDERNWLETFLNNFHASVGHQGIVSSRTWVTFSHEHEVRVRNIIPAAHVVW